MLCNHFIFSLFDFYSFKCMWYSMHFGQALRFHFFFFSSCFGEEGGSFSVDWFPVAGMWDELKEMERAWWLAGHHEISDLNLVIGATILDCFQDQILAATYWIFHLQRTRLLSSVVTQESCGFHGFVYFFSLLLLCFRGKWESDFLNGDESGIISW